MFRIIKTEIVGQTINTEVEFTYSDGNTETKIISHFRPDSKEEVLRGIQNNEDSYELELTIPNRLLQIKQELD